MAPRPVEHPDPERVQQRTVRVLVAAQVLGGAAIGVGAAVSPLLAKEILVRTCGNATGGSTMRAGKSRCGTRTCSRAQVGADTDTPHDLPISRLNVLR
jgi:hypothetical protein